MIDSRNNHKGAVVVLVVLVVVVEDSQKVQQTQPLPNRLQSQDVSGCTPKYLPTTAREIPVQPITARSDSARALSVPFRMQGGVEPGRRRGGELCSYARLYIVIHSYVQLYCVMQMLCKEI